MASVRSLRNTPQSGIFTCSDGTQAPWTYKPNSRTRREGVRIDGQGNIRVSMPLYHLVSPQAVLEQFRPFIEETLAKQAPSRRFKEQNGVEDVVGMETLALPGLAETWRIQRVPSESTQVRLHVDEEQRVIRLSGLVSDPVLVGSALRKAVIARAKKLLPPLLEDQARWAGITYTECKVRSARTRWGSCSADGRIMLSATLAFLPPELVLHVMFHELTHLLHHDHGAGFHRMLEQLDPQAKTHVKMLKAASGIVPSWM